MDAAPAGPPRPLADDAPLLRSRRLELTAIALFVLSLVLLPVAVHLTLRDIASQQMQLSAEEITRIVTSVRRYYATNIVERIQAAQGQAVLTERYKSVHGGIPIPATLSIELGDLFGAAHQDTRVAYRFLSDYPFPQRQRAPLDVFQADALRTMRADRSQELITRLNNPWVGEGSFRMATPVIMQAGCVACHNAHPESPKRDWKVGDVRGLQEVEVIGHQSTTVWTFRYMVVYLAFVLSASAATALVFRRQAVRVREAHRDLSQARERERQAGRQLLEKVDELSLLGAVVEGSTFGVTIADARQPDFPLVYANSAFYRLTGLDPAHVIGHNCRFLAGPLTDRAASAAIGQAVREGRPHTTELLNYRADGTTFWNRLTLFPVGGEPGRPHHYVGYQIDITSLREAEAERQRMLAEIQQNQKLESLGVMVAGVAHEVNNPLGIALTATSHIVLSAEAIQRALKENRLIQSDLESFLDKERAAFDLILKNLRRAADLVRSFKEVAADQASQSWRELQARDYLQMLVTSLSPLMRQSRCRLDLTVPEDFSLVAETGSLGQLVTNLVVNATVHAFPEGFAADGAEPPQVQIAARLDGDTVELRVADNGCGIAPEVRPRLFEPFFTTRRGSGGTGLGLFIAHRIATQTLGGTLAVAPATPRGTVFVLRFPRHRTDVRTGTA